MDEKVLISVIVPLYNAEKYLDECISSILNQSFKELELVLINDGSDDTSEEICKKYVLQDKRVHYYFQENEGVISARAYGVEMAQGEFICFVDSDDSLKPDALELMYSKMDDGVDVVVFECNETMDMTPQQYVTALLEAKILSVWGKLFRKNLFDINTFDIPRHLNVGEDFLIQLSLSKNVKRLVRCVSLHKYKYNVTNSTSIMNTYVQSMQYELQFMSEVEAILLKSPLFYLVKHDWFCFRCRYLSGMIGLQFPLDYKSHWFNNLIQESNLYKLSLKQFILIKSIKYKELRYFFIGEKKIKAFVRKILNRRLLIILHNLIKR